MRKRFAELAGDSAAGTVKKSSIATTMKELGNALEKLKSAQEEFDRQNEALTADYRKFEAENRRYRDLFELAPLPYVVTDAKGNILEVNQAAAALLDTPEEFLVDKPLRIYVEKGARSDFLSLLTELRERAELKGKRLCLKPRRRGPVAVSLSASVRYFEDIRSNAKTLELQWVIQDLTEQQKAADRLRESEEKYRSLFENSQEGICRTTPDGSFIAANSALARMLGYDLSEEVLMLRVPQGLCADLDEYQLLLKELENTPDKALRERELLLKKKDGSLICASLSIRAICDGSGPIVGYEWLIQDVTDRKRMEERLRQRERLAAVGSTVAVLTHEISNPLNGMFTLIQMIERYLGAAEQQDPALSAHLRDLKLETQRLVDLLGDFRLFAQSQYTFQPLALHDLVAEVLNLQFWKYAESGIRVEVEVSESLPLIEADKNKLKQALLNLCKNAVEAMAGEGLLTIKASSTDTHVTLEITDTGPGLAEGVDVFEPFVTTKEQGTGLGLPIVRQIVSVHGGTIACSSNPGKGTTFRLVLPLRQRAGSV